MISANWGVASDTGLLRKHNEDCLFARFPVFLVADGMGGHAAGEVASDLAADEFRQLVEAAPLTVEAVSDAIARANRTVLDAARNTDRLEGMGTTLVGLAMINDRDQDLWLAFNVGDSRLYRMIGGSMVQITTDHSEVQELLDDGSISPENARHHPQRNVITRAVGIENSVEPDFWLLPPEPGERFLLCSDGLSGELTDEKIATVLQMEADPTTAATRLVEQAVASGGHDNVTVVVVDVLAVPRSGDVDEDKEDTARGRHNPVTSAPLTAPGVRQLISDPLVQDVIHSVAAGTSSPTVSVVDVPGGADLIECVPESRKATSSTAVDDEGSSGRVSEMTALIQEALKLSDRSLELVDEESEPDQ